MTMKALRAVLAGVFVLALSGCFASEKPLIDEKDSVTPISAGKYRIIDPDHADETSVGLVSIKGKATILSDPDAKDPDELQTNLMREVRAPYYVMMEVPGPGKEEDGYVYMLIRVDAHGFAQFDPSKYCEALETIAKSKGVDIATYGVVKVDDRKDDPDTCYFDRFDALAGAFKMILDSKSAVQAQTFERIE
jgi:hypothetical protein